MAVATAMERVDGVRADWRVGIVELLCVLRRTLWSSRGETSRDRWKECRKLGFSKDEEIDSRYSQQNCSGYRR